MNSADKIYSKALLDLSSGGGITSETIKKDLCTVADVFKNSADLYKVLVSPAISCDKKKMIISDIFSENVSAEIVNFLKLLAEKNKFSDFENILSSFIELSDEFAGIKHVEIRSAIVLSENDKNKLLEKLGRKLSKTVVPDWVVDGDIIGGLVIKYDDNVIDMSIKSKLDKIMKGNV